MSTIATSQNLDDLVEFDSPFKIVDGRVAHADGVYAPEVTHDEEKDIIIWDDKWSAFTGYTGQYSYNGAVMHSSEYLGGRLAEDALEMAAEEPNTGFVIVEVVDLEADDDDDPVGWALLYAAT